MFDFGDDLTIQSYRIPWLIWIQILVLLLLIFLFYCFSLNDDLLQSTASSSSSSATASSSSSSGCSRDLDQKLILKQPLANTPSTVTDYVRHCQVTRSQSIKGEVATMTGRRIEREDFAEGDSFTIYDHPCNYFKLAKLAFLKCLGLDCEPERCPNPEKKKKKKR
ncbi:hypothetical protein LINGRAPRIM_LOCUS866 [Linum grandiflorum]